MSINIPMKETPTDEHAKRRQAAIVITDLLEEDELFRQEVAALLNIDPAFLLCQEEILPLFELQHLERKIESLQGELAAAVDTVNDLRAQLESTTYP